MEVTLKIYLKHIQKNILKHWYLKDNFKRIIVLTSKS